MVGSSTGRGSPSPNRLSLMIDTDFRLLVSVDTPRESAFRAAAAVPGGGVFYYALGGGMGHLMRAHGIARAFLRIDARPFVTLTNARFALPEVPIRLQLEGRPQAEELSALLRELLTALHPSVLVVDAFPAGILGELAPLLPQISCPKIAVLRRLQTAWIEQWDLPRLLPSSYDQLALIEPGARFEGYPENVPTLETPPVLARNVSELFSPVDARAALDHEGEAPLVVAAITGGSVGDYGILRAAETHLQAVCGDNATLRLAAPVQPVGHQAKAIFHVPLMEVLTGVELVIGACGYNLAHETAALGVPAIFLPQRRKYDDQLSRAEGRRVAPSGGELEALMCQHLAAVEVRANTRTAPDFVNGAEAVAGLIATFC
jgi:hypothetical protein